MVEIAIESPARNALSTAVLESLRRQLRAAGGEPVLLTGAGSTFCAGLDLKEVSSLDAAGMRRLLDALEGLVVELWSHPRPTVALVNGHAIAGGCVLALCCDLAVAPSDPKIRIGLNEIALGLSFPPRTLKMVRARLGDARAEKVVLGGALHAPADALRHGLVDEVADQARAVALLRLEERALHPPGAYAAAKSAIRGGKLDLSAEERRHFEEVLVPAWTSAETRAVVERLRKR
ncbi:MAG TPA: enoyl-CoA hydratase/isomerase family protein [Anaeromyxobacteraceae bacterium]|jgi:enoyl-CoA hydratase/carnithine racemase